MSRSLAIQKAVDDCMRQDILRDFLRDNASEVRNMLFTEWNWDTAKRVWQEEARETGMEEGIAIGEARGEAKVLELMAQGYDYEQLKDILKLS